METLIVAIISIVAGAIINETLRYFVPLWIQRVKSSLPKKKSSKARLIMLIKYPFLTSLICLIFSLVSEGKWFVIASCGVCVVVSFFITRDFLNYTINSLIWLQEKAKLNAELELWTDQLIRCDYSDTERVLELKAKLEEIKKAIDLI